MLNLSGKKTLKMLILLVDIMLILLAYVASFYLRYETIDSRNWESFTSLVPWIALLALFSLSIYDLYSTSRKTIWDMIRNLFVSMTLLSFLTMAVSFFFREFALPRSVIFISYFLSILFLCLWKSFFVFLGEKKVNPRILVIADEIDATKLIWQIKFTKSGKITRIHPSTEITRIFELMESHDSILLGSHTEQEKKTQILYQAMKSNTVIFVVPSLYDLLLSKSEITSVNDSMVLAVKPFGFTIEDRFMKRAIDLFVSILGLIVLSPIMLITAIAIKIENPRGSIFYKQKRIGYNNELFTIYKFRTMEADAEDATGPTLAVRNDPRITRVGRLLRPARIDEIPQLLNVLSGKMSIVGPRPEREFFTKQLSQQYRSYQYRNSVKPGITGYAQIMGKYTTDVEDKLLFDLYYIRNYSLWMDITIILRTFVVLLDHSKSEGFEPVKSNLKSNIEA